MQTVLIVVHLIIVLALIGVVLLQRSEGGLGLGGGGGGGVSGFMTGRGQANALTRATAILAALFFVTSMTLAVMSHRAAGPRSILDGAGTSQPARQQPGGADNLLDTLRQQQNQGTAPAPAPPPPHRRPLRASPPARPRLRNPADAPSAQRRPAGERARRTDTDPKTSPMPPTRPGPAPPDHRKRVARRRSRLAKPHALIMDRGP